MAELYGDLKPPFQATTAAPNEYYMPQVPAWATTEFDLYLRSLPFSDQAKAAIGQLLVPLYRDYARTYGTWNVDKWGEYLRKLDPMALLWAASPERGAQELATARVVFDPQIADLLGRHFEALQAEAARTHQSPYQVLKQLTEESARSLLSSYEPEWAYRFWAAQHGTTFNPEGRQRLAQAYDTLYTSWAKGDRSRSFLDYVNQFTSNDLALMTGPAADNRVIGRTRWLTY